MNGLNPLARCLPHCVYPSGLADDPAVSIARPSLSAGTVHEISLTLGTDSRLVSRDFASSGSENVGRPVRGSRGTSIGDSASLVTRAARVDPASARIQSDVQVDSRMSVAHDFPFTQTSDIMVKTFV